MLRFAGSRGSILREHGYYVMLGSGAYCSDGDSDAFRSVFESTSRNGRDWSRPRMVISTDYTFAASAAQEADPTRPLGISAYYSGRAYSPAAVRGHAER